MRTLFVFIVFLSFPAPFHANAKERLGKSGVNIVFGLDPGTGNYDGVTGKPTHSWNHIDVGMQKLKALTDTKGRKTSINLSMSANDGEWGITGHKGVFHAYLYHNSRGVDLSVNFDGITPGRYRIHVYAHGDAPDQNASIELKVGSESYGRQSTLNDGTWDFRSLKLKEGNQYVTFDFDVTKNESVSVTSHRDGSSYSMFNAIQIVPLSKKKQKKPKSR